MLFSKKRNKRKIYNKIKLLFPIEYKKNKLTKYLKSFFEILHRNVYSAESARIINVHGKKSDEIIREFSILPEYCDNPLLSCKKIVLNFFHNIPRWRSPLLQYNVGTSVNTAASAMYALALDENIYNINDGLAGNALLAEQAVSNILSDLANLENKAIGLFTFGGTATNYYASKLGIMKADPLSRKNGNPAKLKIVVTQDAHFSHVVSADWLGIGIGNVITIKAKNDRSSDLIDAEEKIRDALMNGYIVSSIIINGGTTYDHMIDNIGSFVKLRNDLVDEFGLTYKPHLHVDAVIGWAWLFFKEYDFDVNELDIHPDALKKIKIQYEKIAEIKFADSWGVDFHKGVGGCPVDCSIVIINNASDLNLLSKKEGSVIDIHQLAPEFSLSSPADFTLETSRSGGPPLAALASLYTLGKKGYQRNLANLIEQCTFMKELLANYDDIAICNDAAIGYVIMLRLYPLEFNDDSKKSIELFSETSDTVEFSNQVNKYMKEFFSWDSRVRMAFGYGIEYSFSGGYFTLKNGVKVSGIKLYPVSPHVVTKHTQQAVNTLISQKSKFDKHIWKKTK